MQRLRGLHDADGVGEGLEVAHQRPAVRGSAEERRQLGDVGRGQAVIPELLGQFHHRRGPEAAVEVVVQQGLGRLLNVLERQRGGHLTLLLT